MDNFRRAIRTTKNLSRTADDNGQGTGDSDFNDGDDGGQFFFRIPIFEDWVSPRFIFTLSSLIYFPVDATRPVYLITPIHGILTC